MTPDDTSKLLRAIVELDSLSDRAAAVLGFALIDAALERLARRIIADPDDDLFGTSGFLGSASEKVEALFQFGFLPTEIYQDLTLLRRIRNEFSHRSEPGLTFDSVEIAQRIEHLHFAKRYFEIMEPREAEFPFLVDLLRNIGNSAKEEFTVTCSQIVLMLDGIQVTRIVPRARWEF